MIASDRHIYNLYKKFEFSSPKLPINGSLLLRAGDEVKLTPYPKIWLLKV